MVPFREWTVASGLIERGGELLLVRNVRRGGVEDWSTPGGVVDAEDASLLAALTARSRRRPVSSSANGSDRCTRWLPRRPISVGGCGARCISRVAYDGEITIADPDGIVVEASYCVPSDAHDRLSTCPQWVREPLAEWLIDRWELAPEVPHRRFVYDVFGTSRTDLRVERR